MKPEIPKRLIQVWGGKSEPPFFSKASAINLKLLNPNYEYLFFDDAKIDQFVEEFFPQYKNVFSAFRFPIQRFDFFRYLAIYQLGGFYFDMDILLVTSLDTLLASGCVFAFEELSNNHFMQENFDMDWQIAIYGFGASAKHPFIGNLIANCVKAQNDPAWLEPMMSCIPWYCRDEFYVLNSTGPGLASRTLAEYPNSEWDIAVLFPDDVTNPQSWNLFGSYGLHVTQGSWHEKKGFLHRRLMARWMLAAKKKSLQKNAHKGKTRTLNFKHKSNQTS